MKKVLLGIVAACACLGLYSCDDDDNKTVVDPESFGFSIEDWNGTFSCGTTKTFNVTFNQPNTVLAASVNDPAWAVSYADRKLTVTAPEATEAPKHLTTEVTLAAISEEGYVKTETLSLEIEVRTLTFEDADAKLLPYTLAYCSKQISTWSDLIDSKQYGGELLYGSGMGMSEPYWWYDENNTNIKHVMNGNPDWGENAYCYWNGGHALSNYFNADFTGKTFNEQLEIAVTGATAGHAGHNGSANFCVHNGYADAYNISLGMGKLTGFTFGDDSEHVIDHLYIVNTSYGVNYLTNGDATTPAATASTWVKVIAYGWDKAGQSTGQAEFYLCKDGKIVTEWTKFDLTPLGKVARVEFNFECSDDLKGQWGMTFPAYFAYDDVAVLF